MDVKEAIKRAKGYVLDVFSDEGVKNLGLEEVEHSDGTWKITLGFSRPWDRFGALEPMTGYKARSYRVVSLRDADGEVESLRLRDPVE